MTKCSCLNGHVTEMPLTLTAVTSHTMGFRRLVGASMAAFLGSFFRTRSDRMYETSSDLDSDIRKAVELLRKYSIRVVAFDMDQTAVAMHSRGRLRRDKLNDYLDRASRDFVALVPALHQEGFGLCIATHSDEAEFKGPIRPETHILGSELATSLINRYFSQDIVSSFFVVAFNPRVRKEGAAKDNLIKRRHMRLLMDHFEVGPESILFFDDTKEVVKDCTEYCGVRTVHVRARHGFLMSDILNFDF